MQVANQQADLTREVTTVGMMEAPDIIDFLVEGQLLVTTGFHFAQDIPSLIEVIKEMHQRKCAAIGIKDQRYFSTIPAEVIAVADQLQFPILLLPKDVGLSVVVRDLLHRLLNSQSDQLKRVIETTNELSNLILEKEDTELFLEKIADRLKKDLFIINSHYEIIYCSSGIRHHAGEIEQALRLGMPEHLLDLTHPLADTYSQYSIQLFPISTNFRSEGQFLGILNEKEEDFETKLLIQQIVNLLGFSTLRALINQETKRQIKNDLFTSIISGKTEAAASADQLALQEIDTESEHKCAIISINTEGTAHLINYKTIRFVHDYIKWFFDERNTLAQLFIDGQELVLFLPTAAANRSVLEQLLEFLTERFAGKYVFIIGYSHSSSPLTQLATLYKEASDALSLAENPKYGQLIEYRPKIVSELLQLIPTSDQISYIENNLHGLMTLENQVESQELIETLYQYFYYSRAINKVAAALFIHRNTVIYRLKKIEQILGISLDDPEVRMRLMIAVLLMYKAEETPE
ncbi:PucR family transcriptional regulator [Candidatus Enterococcus moelleringii]|uniref:PucR family transcriptional regulator n=1 Tax=Candidatus Enterococcus moelleringii TaxID=2815325 RepID=UPI00325BAE78